MNEDPFSKNAQGISKIYREVLLFRNFLQIKPQVKNMNIKYYDLYYTVTENRDKKIVNGELEKNDNDYINFDDIVILNHKRRETILKEINLRSHKNHFKYFLLYK